AMKNRRDKYPNRYKKNDAGEQRVEGGEQLSGVGMEWINWPHPAQNHGGIQDGINPCHPLQNPVAEDTNQPCHTDHEQSKRRVTTHAAVKGRSWNQWLTMMLKHKVLDLVTSPPRFLRRIV